VCRFTEGVSVLKNDLTTFDAIRGVLGIEAALVVGFEGMQSPQQDWAKGNNEFIATAAKTHPWIAPVAFARPSELTSKDDVESLVDRGFVGVSLYVFSPEDAAEIAAVPNTVWATFARHHLLVSVNSKGASWKCWDGVLATHPDLRVLVSHLGLPDPASDGIVGESADLAEAASRLASVLPLAQYPGVHVKLSGFYAIALPEEEHPHLNVHPLIRALLTAFGPDRLLWGSDFPPVLDHSTVSQTVSMFKHMPWLPDDDRRNILGRNLLRLIADARNGAHELETPTSPNATDVPAVATILSALVATPSVNPAYLPTPTAPQLDVIAPVPSGHENVSGELRMATLLSDRLEAIGADVFWDAAARGRPAVYGLVRGSGVAPKKLLGVDVHLDTVGVGGCADPFSGAIDIAAGRLHGRGACDTKATLAVVLDVLECAHAAGVQPEHDLLIAGTVDEEAGPLGAARLVSWLESNDLVVDELLVAEPTNCVPVRGHKGALRFKFIIKGTPAHSAQPSQGKNALVAAAAVVQALDRAHADMQVSTAQHGELGAPSLTPTVLHSGEGVNVVPGVAEVWCDRRLVDGENLEAIAVELERLARTAAMGTGECTDFEAVRTCSVGPYILKSDDAFLAQLESLTGTPSITVDFGTNASEYCRAQRLRGVAPQSGGRVKSTVVIGPGSIDQAHQDDEWIDISELVRMRGIVSRWWGLDIE
jgi:acetylornithine deacetylase/succinyl-diaminopimelate desuccinylase-like protein/predicted TIM-barrel fold metal-dependent hydrolase